MKLKPIFKYFLLAIISISFIQCSENEDNAENNQSIEVFSPGIPFLVGSEEGNSTFSFYNTSPESPDGKMIAYVKILSEQNSRFQSLNGELWVCNSNLLEHRKVTDLQNFNSHNGVEAQWIDNTTIAFFDDGKIKIVNLEGQPIFSPFEVFSIGHHPFGSKILYSLISQDTNLYTIIELDLSTGINRIIADASNFSDIVNQFNISELRPMNDWRIRHLKYSPDGSKIAFRIDVGDNSSTDRHVVSISTNGDDIEYFGKKPMHYAWFDTNSIMGHDDIVDDGLNNDQSTRRWTRNGAYIETLAGPGNHLSASTDRSRFATESWYGSNPVVLRVYKRGHTNPFWQENVSVDNFTVWDLGNHVNPAFSRDGKRVYYHKNTSSGKSQAYMVVLPDN